MEQLKGHGFHKMTYFIKKDVTVHIAQFGLRATFGCPPNHRHEFNAAFIRKIAGFVNSAISQVGHLSAPGGLTNPPI
jgi:hypothetical protein